MSQVLGLDALDRKLKTFDETFRQYLEQRIPEELKITQQEAADLVPVDEGVGQVVRFVERLDVAPLPTGDEERPLTQAAPLIPGFDDEASFYELEFLVTTPLVLEKQA